MNQVYGKLTLDISLPVQATEETLALMEASFKLHPERLVIYELYAVDCKGHRFKVDTHNTGKVNLDEFLEI
jgi:hypothetical protein